METSATHTEPSMASIPSSMPLERRVTEIAALLRSLDETAAGSACSADARNLHENDLVQVRLGVVSSLFMALRSKHAPTAGHSMRVALGCSTWTLAMGLPDKLRDHIEVAALLHDVGKIGVPDHILHKPGKLTGDEMAVVAQHVPRGLEILGCCSAPKEILDIVRYSPAWFDGSKPGFDRRRNDLPLGARIVAIVDAFDAMTTDHVYRRAMSRERALAELYDHAGTQFDPDLVAAFNALHEQNQLDLHSKVAQRWLEALAPDLASQPWTLGNAPPALAQQLPHPLFQQKLFDNMHDAVVFVDSQLEIFLWNRGAERLTGISSQAAFQRTWQPRLFEMRDERGSAVADADCPVAHSIQTGAQTLRRLYIAGRGGKERPVDLHAAPVVGSDGTTYGATILLHDASNETTLEERCQNLHAQATKDPLTQVANRAEFDRVHAPFLKHHVDSRLPCSLIICDIDHFKQVNDTFGHQAGDEAIKSFTTLLKGMCRHGDLVARYGGEEFVVLCADCNNATAAARAEQVRRAIADCPQPMMSNKRVTVSFGVTENQAGDTPETMLRRADRALLQAKESGRNRVVQLGSGHAEEKPRRRRGWWPFGATASEQLIDTCLVTNVPMEVAVEKLRGFVADHNARVDSVDETEVTLTIEASNLPMARRQTDRPVPFIIELKFAEGRIDTTNSSGLARGDAVQTRVHVVIRPRRDRDRRQQQAADRARSLLASLKSYLMAHEAVLGEVVPQG